MRLGWLAQQVAVRKTQPDLAYHLGAGNIAAAKYSARCISICFGHGAMQLLL